MKLLTLLKKKPLCNELHFVLIAIILLMISFKYYWFFGILALYFIFLFKNKHLLFPSLIVILIIVFRVSLITINKNTFKMKDNYEIYVIDIKNENSYYAYVGSNKFLIYDYDHECIPGDRLNVSIKLIEDKKSYTNDFDNEYYLLGKNVTYVAKIKNKEFIRHGFSFYAPKYFYSKYLSNNLSLESFNYVNAVVFGNNNLESDVKDAYSILGISHILAISGLHILLIYKFLSFLLFKLFNYYDDKIPIILIGIYVFFIGFPISALRAFLFLVLNAINKKNGSSYTKLDILSISVFLMILFRPYCIYNTGFILSFIVSFIFIYRTEIIGRSSSSLIKQYKTYVLIFFSTLPFVLNISNRISVISIILSPILSSLISFILLPLSYLDFLLPIFDYGLKYIFIGINIYVVNLKNILLIINIQSFNFYMMLVYYLIFGFIIYTFIKKKYKIVSISVMAGYLLGILYFRFVNPYANITFIDCGQGDSALIELPHGDGVMLVDAYNSYNYLKTKGLYKIDYLVLTHSDSDHIGDYIEIINNFNVKNILYPSFDDRFSELLMDINVNKLGINDNYIINNDFNIKLIGPINKYDDPNSNSIVFRMDINSTKILFTGDMTENEENDCINKYKNELDSDILKVAHHGSNTSSSIEFIDLVKPDVSIISVGFDNKYGLPNDEIVERLKNYSTVYMTKDSGNINVKISKDKYAISTYR